MAEVSTGQIIHLSDVTLPENVISVALALGEDHDLAIASIIAPRGASEEEEEEAAAAAAAEEEDADAEEGSAEEGDSEE
jgi:large subunit ribosomal protein L25